MKKISLIFAVILLAFQFTYAQWTTTGTSITTTNSVGIGSSLTPTHSLTISYNGTPGTAWYNTTDQTTNYERLVLFQPAISDNGLWEFKPQSGGTGSFRGMELETSGADFRMLGSTSFNNTDNSNFDLFANVTGAGWNGIRFASSIATTSGVNSMWFMPFTVQQSGTAGYRGIQIAVNEQSIGTGIHYLVDAGTSSAAFGANYTSKFTVDDNGNGYFLGNVGIGTTIPDAKLTVNGTIHTKQINVDVNVPGPDFVFYNSYRLKTLPEVNRYISLNHHLPQIPSAKDMEQNGIDVSKLDMQLLQKIEELTLYTIASDKTIKNEKAIITQQQIEIKEQQTQIDMLIKKVAELSKGNTK
jgi:uncharacterized coiled-coil protein SlyX